MTRKPLTQHLLSQHTPHLKPATTHDFLTRAGAGKLSSKPLCEWLVQDKHYQFAYIQFIGRLISKINLTPPSSATNQRTVSDENLYWKTLNTLLAALSAIRDEIEFYDKTVSKYELEIKMEPPNEVTRQYRQLFEESSAPDKPLIAGLVVLWATEFCYLQAWSFAKEQQSGSASVDDKQGAIAALHKEFIPNWTSDEFRGAVDALAEVANAWGAEVNEAEEERCKDLWVRVLELEARFWPDVD